MSLPPLLARHCCRIAIRRVIFSSVISWMRFPGRHDVYEEPCLLARYNARYERGENFIEINPSRYGLATVHNRDVLIYCISQW